MGGQRPRAGERYAPHIAKGEVEFDHGSQTKWEGEKSIVAKVHLFTNAGIILNTHSWRG